MISLLWPWYKYMEFWQKVDCMSPKQKALMPIKAAQQMLDFIGVRFLSDLRVFLAILCCRNHGAHLHDLSDIYSYLLHLSWPIFYGFESYLCCWGRFTCNRNSTELNKRSNLTKF